jgi:23S rRNA (adenine-N6)-dimethyltransferase
VPGRRRALPSTAPGAHFLGGRIAAEIVAASGVGDDDLVLDLGAGVGALTAPLAAAGARVVAVERSEGYAARLTRRFANAPNVTVVRADLRDIPLPGRAFRVVANPPFAVTSDLLRLLLDPAKSPFAGADLVLQRHAVARLVDSARAPSGAWWGARFTLREVRVLPPWCFRPAPSVTAAVLRIRPRPMPSGGEAALAALLRQAARTPERPARAALRGHLGPRQLRLAGVEPADPIGRVDANGWWAIVNALTF